MPTDHPDPLRGDGPPLVDLDHAATAPLHPAAAEAMEPFLGGHGGRARYGNPSGSHPIARDALRALDEAREAVASGLGCRPGEVVFTSGGTEADNQAVSGGLPPRPGRPVCSAVEHHAVLAPTEALGGVVVQVDRLGRIDLDALADTLDALVADPSAGSGPGVGVVSIMAANNELGTVNDLAAVAEVVHRHAPGTPVHSDAVQWAVWFGGEGLAPVDMFSISAHKMGGPKGVGALVVREGTPIAPLLRGGSQERDRRGGTHDVAGIVGFAAAVTASREAAAEVRRRTAATRDLLAEALVAAVPGVSETVGPAVAAAVGAPADRSHLLPGHLHLTVDDATSEELLLVLEQAGICASTASSCASGASGASHVLAAIGLSDPPAPWGSTEERAALRLSIGPDLGAEAVDGVVAALAGSVERVRTVRDDRRRRAAARAGTAPAAEGAS